jgi:aspartokinase
VPSETAPFVLAALENVFVHEIEDEDIDRIWSTSDVSIVTVVGAGMRHTVGVAGKVFSQLGNHGVNILAIAQGSSEVSISLVVDTADTENAVRALHSLIIQ